MNEFLDFDGLSYVVNKLLSIINTLEAKIVNLESRVKTLEGGTT